MSRTRVHPEANGDFSKVAGKAGPAGDQQQNVMPPNPAAFSLARQLTTRLGGGRRRPYSQTSEGSEQASRDGSDRSRPSTISRSLSARCAAFAAAQRSGVGELITPAQRMDGRATPRGQQEQGSGVGGCCAVSASGSDASQPPARAPPEV